LKEVAEVCEEELEIERVLKKWKVVEKIIEGHFAAFSRHEQQPERLYQSDRQWSSVRH